MFSLPTLQGHETVKCSKSKSLCACRVRQAGKRSEGRDGRRRGFDALHRNDFRKRQIARERIVHVRARYKIAAQHSPPCAKTLCRPGDRRLRVYLPSAAYSASGHHCFALGVVIGGQEAEVPRYRDKNWAYATFGARNQRRRIDTRFHQPDLLTPDFSNPRCYFNAVAARRPRVLAPPTGPPP